MNTIQIEHATFGYGKEPVFEDVNLTVGQGEIFCLFGPNGCGKSTLIQCILGLLKLSDGRITLRGKDVSQMKPRVVAKEAAYIPQVHEKPFPFKVIDVVLMGRAAHTGMFSLPSSEDKVIAEEALKRVGIAHLRERPYTQLSGGETQMVLVARALAQQTPILVMDEPTAHLDFRNDLSFLQTTVRLVRETGITVVMATHFPNHSFYFEGSQANSVVALMNQKRITIRGTPSAVVTEDNMSNTFDIESKVLSYTWDEREMKQIVPLKLKQTP